MRYRTMLRALLLGTLLCGPLYAAPLPPAADAPRPKAAPKPVPKPAAPASVAPRATVAAPAPAPKPAAPAPLRPSERELHIVATVEAAQDWKKNDPEYPGDQWSKGTTKQRYEIRTRLRSDGRLEVRNLLDPNPTKRMEAKTIHLARQVKRQMEAEGKPFNIPRTPAEKQALSGKAMAEIVACAGDFTCNYETQTKYAAIFAAMENPEMLEEDTEPGRYLYFLPYKGCPEASRVQLTMAIDGVRYNKTADKFLPFSERRSADSVNTSDGLALCRHMLAVIDTKDPQQPMWQETIFVPRPEGITEYTESKHTAREKQPQPMPTAPLDWMTEMLRHAKPEGTLSASLPLPLALNGNQTVLGLFTGTAKVTMQWSFKEVPAAPASAKPVKP